MTTTMAEPEWDEQTRETVIALAEVELCPICGRSAELCQSAERQEDWVADAPVRCHATTALLRAQARVTEETNPQSAALFWPVGLKEARRG